MNPQGRAFDHVVIVMFENEYRGYVHRHPYMRSLAAQGIDMATYFGVMHPSNPNYTASMAGSICNVTRDPTYHTLMPGSLPVNPPPSWSRPPSSTVCAAKVSTGAATWRPTRRPTIRPPPS